MKARFIPRVQQPCPEAWDAMAGNEKRRFCETCGLHVHNLNALTLEEREAVFARRGERKCVAYLARDRSIEVRTRLGLAVDRLFQAFRPIMAALAVVLPFGAGGCATSRQQCATPPPPPTQDCKRVREVDSKFVTGGVICPTPLWRRILFFWE